MGRLPSWAAGAVPALFSLLLSISTIGGKVHWQDSGFFIAGVKDLGVLYPHGFVLYLLACKAWTLVLPGGESFTLGVHLFSSLCAAAAAGALGMAGRELLLAKGRFRTGEGVSDARATACGAAAACLAASGYTFWLSGIYAKPYAMLYAALAFLLWAMVRCSETGSPRSLTVVAALIGLSWAAHPSATGAGIALLGFTALHARAAGARGLAWRTLLAAVVAAGPSLLLPLLSQRLPAVMFGRVESAGEILAYLGGSRFLGQSSAFSVDGDRWMTCAEYAWEEFLGLSLLLAGGGALLAARRGRVLLAGVAAWVLPYTAMATSFGMEGQQDHWYVAAWLPAWLLVATALARLPEKGLALATLGGVLWSCVANHADLDFRGYPWAERYADLLLDPLPPNAILVVASDDGASTTFHAQQVRGRRPDVLVVRAAHLDAAGGWYDELLVRKDPTLEPVRYRRRPGPRRVSSAIDFAVAQAKGGRPVFLDLPVEPAWVPPGYRVTATGALQSITPADRPVPPFAGYPDDPVLVRRSFRRERGVRAAGADGRRRREAYERRLFVFLLRARFEEARARAAQGDSEGALAAYLGIVGADPEAGEQEEVAFPLGMLLAVRGRHAEAEPHLLNAVSQTQDKSRLALGLALLGAIAQARGNAVQAEQLMMRAMSVPGLPEPVVRELIRLRTEGVPK